MFGPVTGTGRAGVVAAGLLLCTGCWGGSADTPAPSTPAAPTGSPSASTSPAPVAPTLPAAAKQPTPEGAVAFFRYFWDVYNYSYAALDTKELRRISESSCKFCLDSANSIEGRKREGGYYVGGIVSVSTAVAAPDNPKIGLIVNSIIDQTASRTVTADGVTEQSVPASTGMRIDSAVQWKGEQWRMLTVDAVTRGSTP